MTPTVDRLRVSTFTVPNDPPEGDGTLSWDHTTAVVVETLASDGTEGLGYAYGNAAVAAVVRDLAGPAVIGRPVADLGAAWTAMVRAIRNFGRPGICSMAIAAVDIALWDLHARCSGIPLHRLLGSSRDAVPAYGSGGFTTLYGDDLQRHVEAFLRTGVSAVKIKVGTDWGARPARDMERMAQVREVIGDRHLFIDANGAFTVSQAIRFGQTAVERYDIRWYEEPVSSDDIEGLRRVAAALPIDISAGEYGYDLHYFRRMIGDAGLGCVQADAGRCAGITEWRRIAALAASHNRDMSTHCGPALHLHVACSVPNVRHVEYFADHVEVENRIFEGVVHPVDGMLHPADGRPGLGLTLRPDAEALRDGPPAVVAKE